MMDRDTRVVNLFAGPGAGKSTTAAGVFSLLKLHGVSCELVTEYAKDLTWGEDRASLRCQPHVFGEQLRRMERLRGKVDIIVTDSPLLLSIVYWSFRESYIDELVNNAFNSFTNINFKIERVKPFVQAGRNHSEEEARNLDQEIEDLLEELYHPYFKVFGDELAINSISLYVLEHVLGIGKRFSIVKGA